MAKRRRGGNFRLAVLAPILAACVATAPAPPVAPLPASVDDLATPAVRPFRLAVTTFPPDFTETEIAGAYGFSANHGDMVAHHIDKGVPWPEALAGTAYHPRVEAELAQRAAAAPEVPRYLAISAIAVTRDGLNGYWARKDRGGRPGDWRSREFDDPAVVTAYVNYATDLVRRLEPAYLVYGIEVNMLAENDAAAFARYVTMTGQVYRALKQTFPALPLVLSFHAGTVVDDPEHQIAAIRQLLPFTDMVAVSSYPYMATSIGRIGPRHADPATLPGDWFDRLAALAPEKPFAIAETGFPAEPFAVPGLRVDSSERRQADYVKRVLRDAERLDAAFVVWFLGRDIDALYRRVGGGATGNIFKLFRDTGLADGQGNGRLALRIWDAWLDRPRGPAS